MVIPISVIPISLDSLENKIGGRISSSTRAPSLGKGNPTTKGWLGWIDFY